MVIHCEGKNQQIFKHFDFFKSGSFYLKDQNALALSELINKNLSTTEKNLAQAKKNLSSNGFSIPFLGGNIAVNLLDQAINQFESSGLLLNENDWLKLEDYLINSNKSNMMCAINYVHKWILKSENDYGGRYDVLRRTFLAVLYRRTDQIQNAFEVSKVIQLPKRDYVGLDSSVAVLSTICAACLMDLFEIESALNSKPNLLIEARKLLNHANAISRDNSEHIMKAYQRLKSLEKSKT